MTYSVHRDIREAADRLRSDRGLMRFHTHLKQISVVYANKRANKKSTNEFWFRNQPLSVACLGQDPTPFLLPAISGLKYYHQFERSKLIDGDLRYRYLDIANTCTDLMWNKITDKEKEKIERIRETYQQLYADKKLAESWYKDRPLSSISNHENKTEVAQAILFCISWRDMLARLEWQARQQARAAG